MNCEYCLNIIKTCPLSLRCCGYIVCYEHYTDIQVCPICSSRFDINECLLFLKNQITFKNYNFQQQVEDFRIRLNDFYQLKKKPEIILAKHLITDDKIKSWLLNEINSVQLHEIQTKTMDFITDTVRKIEHIENKQEHIEMIDRRIEILKEINQNFNLEKKLIENFNLKKHKLVHSTNLCINKFVVDLDTLITSTVSGEIRSLNSNLKKSTVLTRFQSSVLCLKLINKKRIVFGLANGTIQIWSRKTKKILKIFDAHSSQVVGLQKLNSSFLASCSSNGEVKLWDFNTQKLCLTYDGHALCVNGLEKASTNKKLFASCSNDKSIRIWNLSSHKYQKILCGHQSIVNCMKLVHKNCLASGSLDGKIKIWDIQKGVCVRTLFDEYNSISYIEKFFNKTFVVGTMTGKLKFWDRNSGVLKYTIDDAHNSSITCIKKPKKKCLITCSEDKTIKYWRINNI